MSVDFPIVVEGFALVAEGSLRNSMPFSSSSSLRFKISSRSFSLFKFSFSRVSVGITCEIHKREGGFRSVVHKSGRG